METVSASSDYNNYEFIVEDIYAIGGNYVVSNLDTLLYAFADYPHWQVLTLSSLYKPDTYNVAPVSRAFNIRLTRPLVLIDSTSIHTSVAGLHEDSVRYGFYDYISDAFIKPEDGVPEEADITKKSTQVRNDDNC